MEKNRFKHTSNSSWFTAFASAPPSTRTSFGRLYFGNVSVFQQYMLMFKLFTQRVSFTKYCFADIACKQKECHTLGIKASKEERGFLPPLKGWVSTSAIG